MTESVSSSVSNSQAQQATETLTGGGMLKKAREASGLHIGAMAVALKVPVKKLEALEADQFDVLPDMVFVRALASSICRNLKIDPNPILERLPNTAAPRLKTDESGINTPFRETGDALNLPWREQLSKPMVLGVVLVLVAILVLVFVPFHGFGSGAKASKVEPVDTIVSEPAQVAAPMASAAVEPAPVVNQPLPALPAHVIESVPLPVQPATPALNASSSPAPTPITGVTPEPSVTANVVAPNSAGAAILMKAKGASWVEIVDAKGSVQVRKIVNEGESVVAAGAMPLSVVVGKADVVEVQVHGKPFDLTRVAKENVARFEVK